MPTTSPAHIPTRKPVNVQTCKRVNAPHRGAPRGNANALTHGAYSSRNLTPLSTIMLTLASLRRQFKPSPAAPPPGSIEATQDAFWQLNACCDPSASPTIHLDQFARVRQTSAFLWRQRMRQYHLTCDLHDLEIIAPRAIDIIHVDFRDHDITRDADLPWWFSPELSRDSSLTNQDQSKINNQKSSIGAPPSERQSDHKPRFLTDAQWTLIEPLIPTSGSLSTSDFLPPV